MHGNRNFKNFMADPFAGMNLARRIVAKCPKCGSEKEVKRILGSESAEGDCDNCNIHFVTSTWWHEK